MAFRFNATIVVICLEILCVELVLAKTSINSTTESTDKIVEPVPNVNQFHENNVDLNKNSNHNAGNNVPVSYGDKISDPSNANEVNINAKGQPQKRVKREIIHDELRQLRLSDRIKKEKLGYQKLLDAIKAKRLKEDAKHEAYIENIKKEMVRVKGDMKKNEADYQRLLREKKERQG